MGSKNHFISKGHQRVGTESFPHFPRPTTSMITDRVIWSRTWVGVLSRSWLLTWPHPMTWLHPRSWHDWFCASCVDSEFRSNPEGCPSLTLPQTLKYYFVFEVLCYYAGTECSPHGSPRLTMCSDLTRILFLTSDLTDPPFSDWQATLSGNTEGADHHSGSLDVWQIKKNMSQWRI